MNIWIVILAVALGSYVLRASMFVALGGRELPAWTDRPLGLVGPAAIAALVASLLFTSSGAIAAAPISEIGACAAGFVAVRRSGNVMHAFSVGLPALWVLMLAGF